VIDLYVWVAKGSQEPGTETTNGYHVIRWSYGGMSFAAVSDLNPDELNQFKELLMRN
jgi:anti-sigma factor RsiW